MRQEYRQSESEINAAKASLGAGLLNVLSFRPFVSLFSLRVLSFPSLFYSFLFISGGEASAFCSYPFFCRLTPFNACGVETLHLFCVQPLQAVPVF